MDTKVLIVDDSALMRRQLTQMLAQAGGYAWQCARNGREAVAANLEFEPDVITLDINMPDMDGLTALSHLMLSRPVGVIMLSSLTTRGALTTLEALALGAVDFLPKPDGTISLTLDTIRAQLLEKIQAAARARVTPLAARTSPGRIRSPHCAVVRPAAPRPTPATPGEVDVIEPELVLVGVSTGGPGTLETILPQLAPHFPCPVVVAQHMPAAFTAPFAQRMDRLCPLPVTEVAAPTPLRPGQVYIARGGADSAITSRAGQLTVLPRPQSREHLWHPSVDLLADSALQHCCAKRLVGVMLTGMGDDGATAFTRIHQSGGRTIAESEESAVVYGMPKALIERGGASMVLPVQDIAHQLNRWVGKEA